MKKAELVVECQMRDIPLTGSETNPQLQTKIMDHCKMRKAMEQEYVMTQDEDMDDPWNQGTSSSSKKRTM